MTHDLTPPAGEASPQVTATDQDEGFNKAETRARSGSFYKIQQC
jgi:hypothetical protein